MCVCRLRQVFADIKLKKGKKRKRMKNVVMSELKESVSDLKRICFQFNFSY